MKIFSTLFLSLLLINHAVASQPTLPNEDMDTLFRATSGGSTVALNLEKKLSSKTDAILFLKNLEESYVWGDKGIFKGDVWYLLTNLGDTEAIQSIYNQYLTGKDNTSRARAFATGLGKISSPVLLSVMGPDLQKQGGAVDIFGGHWSAYEVPYGNAFTVLRIAEYSGYFSPEVVAWAKDVKARHKEYRPDLYLAEVRNFWAENAERIEAGDYASVRPPGTTAAPESPEPVLTDPPTTPPPTLEPLKSSAAAATPTQEQAPEQAPTKDTKPVWWIAGLIILAGGAAFATRKKKTRS